MTHRHNPMRLLGIAWLCLAVFLPGCFLLPTAPSTTRGGSAPSLADRAVAADVEPLTGVVDFGVRSIQTDIGEVASGATVSLIEVETGNTLATTLTTPTGGFSFSFGRWRPRLNTPYYLEAVKGLSNNAPGHAGVRVRTILTNNGSWYSLTSSPGKSQVYITAETTALAIILGYHPELDARRSIDHLTHGLRDDSIAPPTESTFNPTDTGITNADYHRVASLVNLAIAADTDPLYRIDYNPAFNTYMLRSGDSGGSDGTPQIQGLSSYMGGAGMPITIFGRNFGPAVADNVVTFNGLMGLVLEAAPDKVKVEVPEGPATGLVKVTTSMGVSNGLLFTSLGGLSGSVNGAPVPVLTGMAPRAANPGDTVTLTGSNFEPAAGGNQVSVNGKMTATLAGTATTTSFVVPEGWQSGYLQMLRGGMPSDPLHLTIGAPIVVGANRHAAIPGETITLVGANFVPTTTGNTVEFVGGTGVVASASVTTLTVTIPLGAQPGPLKVRTNAGESTPYPFGILAGAAGSVSLGAKPTASAMSPTRGPVGLGVRIDGTGFSTWLPGNVVRFNGIPATITGATPTRLDVIVPEGATTGPVTVDTAGGQVPVGLFTVHGPAVSTPTVQGVPMLTDLTPKLGYFGTTVTLTGSNFDPIFTNNQVSFNGTPATPIDGTSETLVVKVPVGATAGNVTVTHSGGTTTPQVFFVVPNQSGTVSITNPPTVSNVNPTHARVGVTVTVTGTNFWAASGANVVSFNGVSAAVGSATGTTLTCEVPPGATTGPLVVITPSGRVTWGTFTVDPEPVVLAGAPVLTAVTPGSAAVGTPVVVRGSNFHPDHTQNTVKFGAVTAVTTGGSTTQLTALVPVGAVTGTLTVTTAAGASNALAFTVVPDHSGTVAITNPPTVSNLIPDHARVGQGVSVVGTNFWGTAGANFVTLNGAPVSIVAQTPTVLTIIVPAGAQTGPVVVYTPSGRVSAGTFTVDPDPIVLAGVPTLSSVSPTSAAVGTAVTLTGTDFHPDHTQNAVKFGAIAAVTTGGTATSLRALVPAGAVTGNVTVTTTAGTSNARAITVVPDHSGTVDIVAPPTVSAVSPASGRINTTVTLTGTNFWPILGANVVAFNGVPAVITAATATTLTCKVPASATTGLLEVSTPSGRRVWGVFTVDPEPLSSPAVLSSLSPASAKVGATVTLYGSNFHPDPGQNTVKFGALSAVVTGGSTTWLTAKVPVGAVNSNVTVQHEGGTSNSRAFTLVTDSAGTVDIAVPPTVSSVSPDHARVNATVTITGTNFWPVLGANIVTFNGRSAAISAATSTTLACTVPAGATTGPLSVVTPSGRVTWGTFTVDPEPIVLAGAPTLTSVSPTSASVGSVITLRGTNFHPSHLSNTVKFGALTAVTTGGTDTWITAKVPAGAVTGNVTVATAAGTSNTRAFTVVPDNAGTVDIAVPPTVSSVSPGSARVNATVTITGTNFWPVLGANIVTFNGRSAAISAATSTTLTCTVPAGATTGPLAVVTPSGRITWGTFTVDPEPVVLAAAPTLNAITPASAIPGATVTLQGINFHPDHAENTVKFGALTAVTTGGAANWIRAVVPAGAVSGNVTVTTSKGTSPGQPFTVVTDSAGLISITGAPTVSTLFPNHAAPGGTVTITGTNYWPVLGANVVTIGGVNAPVTAATSTTLTITVPGGAQTGQLVVYTPSGAVTWGSAFTVDPAPFNPSGAPILASLTPSIAPVGATIKLAGSGFDPDHSQNTVKFGTVTAVTTAGTATSLTVKVPAGAVTANVTVTHAGGTSTPRLFRVVTDVQGNFDPVPVETPTP